MYVSLKISRETNKFRAKNETEYLQYMYERKVYMENIIVHTCILLV